MGDNIYNNFTPGMYDLSVPQYNEYAPTAKTDGSAGLFDQIQIP